MTKAHHRKKAPDEVRYRLLMATASLASEAGVEAITLDAVARRAGVSKGGLQHHFPSRAALIDALFEAAWNRFHQRIEHAIREDPEAVGRAARAYLRASDSLNGDEDKRLWRAISIVMLGDPGFRRSWAEKVRAKMPAEKAVDLEKRARNLLCLLAADGLWLNDLVGFHEVSPALRACVIQQLGELSRQ